MSDTSYTCIQPVINEQAEQLPDVHLEALGVKLDLPNLDSPNLPLELVRVILLTKSSVVLSDEEMNQAMAAFLAYFQQMQPNLWNKLRTTDNAIGWLTGIVKAWAEQSGIDPKVLSSSNSTTSTTKR